MSRIVLVCCDEFGFTIALYDEKTKRFLDANGHRVLVNNDSEGDMVTARKLAQLMPRHVRIAEFHDDN